MFQPLRLLGILYGVRHFVLNRSKVQQGGTLQVEGLKDASAEETGQTRLGLDERAIHRLIFRAELELSDPNAVRRRNTISQLKLAATSTKQGTLAPPK